MSVFEIIVYSTGNLNLIALGTLENLMNICKFDWVPILSLLIGVATLAYMRVVGPCPSHCCRGSCIVMFGTIVEAR